MESFEHGSKQETPPPSMEDLKASLVVAKKELSACTLTNAWTFTIPSVAIAVPLSIRYGTYSPLVFAAATASGADYYRGMSKCKHLLQIVDKIKLRIAEIENGLVPQDTQQQQNM